MAAVNSTMLELGTKAPDFQLTDVTTGETVTPESAKGKHGLAVLFISNHCPYVKLIKPTLVTYAEYALQQGVGVVAINANDIENYPDDSPEKMKEDAAQFSYPFSYLFDETQETAKAYMAACTPDIFLFDADLKLYYRGQFDSARPGNGIEPTGEDLKTATDLLVEGASAPSEQIPSIGCNIKWKLGNEPDYFG
ncbi:MAG: thioredoxin family protein [Bacteroidetes bacterium]|jgi:peroxiredoxin|nr:MAG: thioredoxin family protein [Bacteroidota bacterium]